MLDNFTAYVTAIDGIPAGTGREGWKTPVSLKAGPRRLSVVFVRGVFTAKADVAFTAVSESAYVVKFASDAQFLGKSSYCEFWIADAATGQAVCERVRVALAKIEPGQ